MSQLRQWKSSILFFCMLLVGSTAYGSIPVTGDDSVCIGTSATYNTPATAGHTYTWSVTPTTNTVATTSGSTATINWSTLGLATVKVVSYSGAIAVDSGTRSVRVFAIPAPYITTGYRVACQSLIDPDDTGKNEDPRPPILILDDANGCVKVCAGTLATYYANGDSTGSWLWAVTGGTIVGPNNDDSVKVLWGAGGTTGSISLTNTNVAGCIGTKNICIDVIHKPRARYAIAPATTPATSVTICLGNTVSFNDLSIAGSGSPIVTWQWFFGDGFSSTAPSPSHPYNSIGTFYPILVVTNQCGCTDTFRAEVRVLDQPGPDIRCPAVACEGETLEYRTGAACPSYIWSVTGGTIVSGAGTPAIRVLWNGTPASGFGTVSLSTPSCAGLCPATTTIEVPIIQSNPVVTGPVVMCAGKTYQLSMPLWPGTRYKWGVINQPGAIIGTHFDNKVTLNFPSAGTWDVHVWWENTLKLCGGDKKITIKVTAPQTIGGATEVCVKPTVQGPYTITGGFATTWTLKKPDNSVITQSGVGSTSWIFDQPGIYVLTAAGTGSFCQPDPIIIKAEALPVGVDSMRGPNEVCVGMPYDYKAYSPISGTIFEWSVIGGGSPLPPTGNTTTVTFSGSGPWQVRVHRLGTTYPYCPSPDSIITVNKIIVNPDVTGPATVCGNSTTAYTANYPKADIYNWTIVPASAGSVIPPGPTFSTAQILWTNVTTVTSAWVIVSATRCGQMVKDSLAVTVTPAPLVAFTYAPTTVCGGSGITFTATPGAASYTWNWGTTSTTTTTNTTTHSFANSTSPTPYSVSVTATGVAAGFSCAPTGTSSQLLTVYPAPIASITTTGATLYCAPATVNTPLQAVVTNVVGTLSYQWYLNGSLIPGATASTYTATTDGSYTVVVVDNGYTCNATSSPLNIVIKTCGPLPPCPGNTVSFTYTQACNEIFATGTGSPGGYGGAWLWSGSPSPAPTVTPTTLLIKWPVPGYYSVRYEQTFPVGGGGTCKAFDQQMITVPLVADFHWTFTCPGTSYTVNFIDHSAYLAGWTLSHSWVITNGSTTYTPTGATPSLTLAAGTWTATETVTATGTPTTTCTKTYTIVVPVVPTSVSIAQTTIGGPIPAGGVCENVPVTFTPSITWAGTPGTISNYVWSFGDGTGSLVNPTVRTYKFDPGFPTPNPWSPSLTITDAVGCQYTASNAIAIWPNVMLGSIAGPTVACSGAPISLSYSALLGGTPATYAWSSVAVSPTVLGIASTYGPTVTGQYNVEVRDAHLCYFKTPNHPVTVLGLTPPVISGKKEYCFGDIVRLSAYQGATGYSYTWYKNGVFAGSGPNLAVTGLGVGTYGYHVVITYTGSGTTCTVSSAVDSVTVNPLPVPPNIGGPTALSCYPFPYLLELTATHPSGATSFFNWSNGTTGTPTTVGTGGAIRLWFTDSNGCVSKADTDVPHSPESYFGWFPSGCYEFCWSQGPIKLYGPPFDFAAWDWLYGGGSILGGTFSEPDPLTITNPGTYQLQLDNGLCTATSDRMEVNRIDCIKCEQGRIIRGELTCDPTNPAGYDLLLEVFNPQPGTKWTFGMNNGPIWASTATLGTPGSVTIPLKFTSFYTPSPSVVTIYVSFILPNGQKCFDSLVVDAPPCPMWAPQRQHSGATEDEGKPAATPGALFTVLTLSPNPAQHTVTVGYNFGTDAQSAATRRRIVIYDALGRVMSEHKVADGRAAGQYRVPVDGLAAAVYLVRMEEDGRTVETQRLSITH